VRSTTPSNKKLTYILVSLIILVVFLPIVTAMLTYIILRIPESDAPVTTFTDTATIKSTSEPQAETTTETSEPQVSDNESMTVQFVESADTADIPQEEAEPVDESDPILYSFSEPVPESDSVEYEYFDDTVFIGDSRMYGLILYTKLKPLDFTAQGSNIGDIQKKAYISINGEVHTLLGALALKSGEYKAIYISTGINELGWNINKFIDDYETLIDDIQKITDVPIYIQLITPVTAKKSSTGILTNEKIGIFNENLRILAIEKSLFLLDPTAIHTLDDGTLDPAHASFDGYHLRSRSYIEVADYYRTHTVDITMYDNLRPVTDQPTTDDSTNFAVDDIGNTEEIANIDAVQ